MEIDQINFAQAPFTTFESPFLPDEIKSLPFQDNPFPVHVEAGKPDHMI